MFYLIVQTFDLFDQFLFVWYNKLLSLLLTALHQQLQQQILIMSTSLGFGLITCGLMIKGSFKMYRHIRNRYYLDPHRVYPGGFYSQMTLREAQLIIGIVDKADRRRSNSNIVHQCLIIIPITEVLHTQQLKSMRLRICYSIVDQTYLYSVITHIIQSFAFNYNIDNKMQKDKKNEDEEELISDSEEAPVTGRSPQQPEAIMYGDTSIQMRCPYCLELIHSEIILKPEFISLALGICFFAIVPNLMMMLLIITLIQLTASRKHRCPLCERELGSDGKFLLFFTDQVYSWSFLSAGFISTKKNLMTFGLIAFAVIVIGFRASLQQEHKFVATTWPEYIRECSQTEPIFCLQKYRDKEFKNWEGHLLKLQDNQQYPTKWYLHAVSLYMKMEPSLHVDKPDILLTLDTDVVYFNKELIRSLVHGDKIRFNCTLHDRERGNLKDVLHFHIDDIEVTGHDKNYALYNTPIEEEWIQIHVQDRGRLTSQPMNSSQIKPI